MTGGDLLSTLEPYFSDGLSVNDIDKVKTLHDIFEPKIPTICNVV